MIKDLPCNAGCHGGNFGAKKGGGYYAYISNKFSNAMQVIDVDPNNDGDISDAAIAGQLVLDADGGHGDRRRGRRAPRAGWPGCRGHPARLQRLVAADPAGWRKKLTPEQLNPIG